jgi:N-acetylneuraminic acid mutarotase
VTKRYLFLSRFTLTLLATLLAALGTACCSGGGTGTTKHEYDIVEVYDAVTGAWVDTTYMQKPRSTAAAVALDGKLYVIGGDDWAVPGRPTYNYVEAYDPATDTWEEKASLNVQRACPGAAVVGGKIYVMGGSASSSVMHNSMEIYDPTTNTWTYGPSMITPRYGPAVGVMGTKIYVMGGFYKQPDAKTGQDINTGEVFDTATNTWSAATNMPTARGQAWAGVVGDTLFVIGGFSDENSVTAANEAFIPGTGWILTAADMPSARAEMDGGVFNGLLFVVGGLWQEGTDKIVLNTFAKYDRVTNSWTSLPALPTTRSEAAAAFLNGKLYVAGGYPSRN